MKSETKKGEDTRPFPPEWLKRYSETELERLAILTIDGGMTDQEAVVELEKGRE